MQKHILYSVFYILVLTVGSGVALAATNLLETATDIKIATISQMYQQDIESEGFSDIPVLVAYGTSELQAALKLEQDYYEREQMSCSIGHDVLWDSQDPDYLQEKQITMTDDGLVNVSLAQGSNIYYELTCANTNDTVNMSCDVNDVVLAEDVSLKDYLNDSCR